MTRSLVQTDFDNSHTIRRWRWTFVVTLLLAIPAVLLAFIPRGLHWTIIFPGVTVRDLLLLLISSVVQVTISQISVWAGNGTRELVTR